MIMKNLFWKKKSLIYKIKLKKWIFLILNAGTVDKTKKNQFLKISKDLWKVQVSLTIHETPIS